MDLSSLGIKLHEGEQVLMQVKPQPKTAWYWIISKTWHLITFLIIFGAFLAFSGDQTETALIDKAASYARSIQLLWIPGIVVLLALAYFWFRKVVEAYDYIITDQRCIFRYGLLSLNTRVIPYSQITDINMRCSFLERWFSLASVRVDCLGTLLNPTGGQRRTNNNTTCMEGLTLAQCAEVVETISARLKR